MPDGASGRGRRGAAGRHGGLFDAGRRGLILGLVLTVTLVAFESLAVATAMPIVARELGRDRALRLGLQPLLPR